MCINANMNESLTKHLGSATANTIVGAAAGMMVSPIGAACGALFGVTAYVVNNFVDFLCSKIDPDSIENKWVKLAAIVAEIAVPFIASVLASIFAASLVGLHIGFGSAVLLTFLACPDRLKAVAAAIFLIPEMLREFLTETAFPVVVDPFTSEEEMAAVRILRMQRVAEAAE